MNRLIIILLTLFASTAGAYADNWCESLIKTLNTASDIDKTIRTTRNPESHELVSAVYDYKFSSDTLFKAIRHDLRAHAGESDFFSESGRTTVIMRLTLDGFRWDCKLQSLEKDKQFLITVNKSGQAMQPTQKPRPSKKKTTEKKSTKTHQQNAGDKTAIEQNNSELKKAEQERRRKLGL